MQSALRGIIYDVQLFGAIFGSNNDNDQRIEKQKIKMLNETFHCKPPLAKDYQQFAPKDASTTKNCLAEGVCMFQLSTRFCQAPFCWADNAPKSQCKRQCQNPVSVSEPWVVLPLDSSGLKFKNVFSRRKKFVIWNTFARKMLIRLQ